MILLPRYINLIAKKMFLGHKYIYYTEIEAIGIKHIHF